MKCQKLDLNSRLLSKTRICTVVHSTKRTIPWVWRLRPLGHPDLPFAENAVTWCLAYENRRKRFQFTIQIVIQQVWRFTFNDKSMSYLFIFLIHYPYLTYKHIQLTSSVLFSNSTDNLHVDSYDVGSRFFLSTVKIIEYKTMPISKSLEVDYALWNC